MGIHIVRVRSEVHCIILKSKPFPLVALPRSSVVDTHSMTLRINKYIAVEGLTVLVINTVIL